GGRSGIFPLHPSSTGRTAPLPQQPQLGPQRSERIRRNGRRRARSWAVRVGDSGIAGGERCTPPFGGPHQEPGVERPALVAGPAALEADARTGSRLVIPVVHLVLLGTSELVPAPPGEGASASSAHRLGAGWSLVAEGTGGRAVARARRASARLGQAGRCPGALGIAG